MTGHVTGTGDVAVNIYNQHFFTFKWLVSFWMESFHKFLESFPKTFGIQIFQESFLHTKVIQLRVQLRRLSLKMILLDGSLMVEYLSVICCLTSITVDTLLKSR